MKNIHNQLQFIALHGDYTDVMNTLVLISAFNRTYTTGHVPTVRKFRGGKQASAIANLQSTMVAATGLSNTIHEWNIARDNFLSIVAQVNPGVYADAHTGQYNRMGIVLAPAAYPIDVEDCNAVVLGAANNLTEYLTLWNTQKVDVDKALCNVRVPYLVNTGVTGYLLTSSIQPDNTQIIYNAPSGVTRFEQRRDFENERWGITTTETKVDPKSVSIGSATVI